CDRSRRLRSDRVRRPAARVDDGCPAAQDSRAARGANPCQRKGQAGNAAFVGKLAQARGAAQPRRARAHQRQLQLCDRIMRDVITFVLGNFTLTLFIIGLVVSFVAVWRAPRPLSAPVVVEALFKWFLFFSIGVSYIYNGIFHTLFADLA